MSFIILPPQMLREIATHLSPKNIGIMTTVNKNLRNRFRPAADNVLARKIRESRNFRNALVKESNRRSFRRFYNMNHEQAMINGIINRELLGGRNTANAMRRSKLMQLPGLNTRQRNILIEYLLRLNQNQLARILFRPPANLRRNAGLNR